MKRLEKVPPEALKRIKSDHERAVDQIMKEYQIYCSFPVRPVKMKIKRTENATGELDTTIIPATSVYLRPNGFIDEDHLDRNAITYAVTGSMKPFPYGHIYAASGHVCLGNIFVPSKISKYCPQQPLETLFLHNDRNLNHGNAKLILSDDSRLKIKVVLDKYGLSISKDAEQCLQKNVNVIAGDEIWVLGSDVYHNAPDLETAITVMTKIYNYIFGNRRK